MKTFSLLLLVLVSSVAVSRMESAETGPSEQPLRIAYGEKTKLKDHLVPGKTVIFDFTSPYCGPCRMVAPSLEKYDREHDDVVVIAVDINRPNVKGIDWQSPVARQYDIRKVPQFKVYGPDGQLMAEGDAADDLVLKQWLNFSWPDN